MAVSQMNNSIMCIAKTEQFVAKLAFAVFMTFFTIYCCSKLVVGPYRILAFGNICIN